jgi:hypothetical protein
VVQVPGALEVNRAEDADEEAEEGDDEEQDHGEEDALLGFPVEKGGDSEDEEELRDVDDRIQEAVGGGLPHITVGDFHHELIHDGLRREVRETVQEDCDVEPKGGSLDDRQVDARAG